jgi:hypothetical protein
MIRTYTVRKYSWPNRHARAPLSDEEIATAPSFLEALKIVDRERRLDETAAFSIVRLQAGRTTLCHGAEIVAQVTEAGVGNVPAAFAASERLFDDFGINSDVAIASAEVAGVLLPVAEATQILDALSKAKP